MIVPFVIGTYGTSDVPLEYLILNNFQKQFSHSDLDKKIKIQILRWSPNVKFNKDYQKLNSSVIEKRNSVLSC